MPRRSLRPSALAAILISLVSAQALALVDGDRHQLWKKHTVQGGSVIIGNTLLASTNAGVVNDVRLQPSETFASLSGLPDDASLIGAYAFWAGSLRPGDIADRLVDMALPDGTIQPNIPVDRCRTLPSLGGGVSSAYVCRSDVTSIVQSHLARLPGGSSTPNGSYNLLNVYAAPGTPSGQSGSCADPNDPCQSAFGGWAVVLVWSSPSAATTKEVMVYDGFLRMDEICEPSFGPNGGCIDGGSSGVAAPITLGGFNAIGRNAEFSFLAFEGDRQLGSPPEPAQNADFMRFNGVELSNNALGVLPKNLFNSVIFNRQGGTPFSGVDIKTLPVTLPAATGFPATTKQVDIQPGSGDGIPDVGPFFQTQGYISNGELFYLSALTLSVDALAPNFKNSRKTVDKTTAAPNDVLTYSVHVENNGSYLADAAFRDQLPAELLYLPGSMKVDGVAVADGPGGTNPMASGLSLGQLWPAGVAGTKNYVDLIFQARVRPDLTGGVICNVGEINATYSPPGSTTITLPPVSLKTNPCTTVQLPRLGRPTKTVIVDGKSTRDAKPGSRLRYTITLSNTGAQAASGLSVRDDLPEFLENLNVVTLPFGAVDASSVTGGAYGTGRVQVENITIPANFSVSIIFDADVVGAQQFVNAGGTDGAPIPNQARLSGPSVDSSLASSDDPTTPMPNDPTTIFVRFGVDLSRSAKTVFGDVSGEVVPGQEVTYVLRVTNSGAQAGTALVDDPMPAGLGGCTVVSGPITDCSNGRLQGQFPIGAGESIDLKFRASVNATAADGTLMTNIAKVSAAERPNILWEARSPTVRVRSQVLWKFTKAVTDLNGGGIEPGDELLYSLVLENVGNRPSTTVNITDALNANLTFISADSGGTLSGRQIRWNASSTPELTSVAPGARIQMSFRARIHDVPNGTIIPNQAQAVSAEAQKVSDDPGTPTPDDPTIVRVVAAPSFVDSTKTVRDINGGLVQPGDLLEYTIIVKNTGRALGTNVVVTDEVDGNLDIEQVQSGGTVSGRTITWNLGSLATAQQAQPLVFTARVKTPLAHNTLIANQARIRSAETPSSVPTDDPDTPAPVDPTSVRVSSSVTLSQSTKTVVDNDGGEPLPGDSLTWTIRVFATGDAPATDVTVLDSIERCLIDVVPSSGGQYDGTRIRWDKSTTPALARVVADNPVSLTFTARIAVNTPDGTRCQNQAAILSPATPAPTLTDDPSTPAPNDPTVIVVVSKPVLSASVKTVALANDVAGNGKYNPGDRVRWTIKVRNTGSEPAKDVRLVDVLPALVEQITLSSGGTLTGASASWNLGDIPARSDREVTIEATILKPLDDGTVIDNQGVITASNVAGQVLTDDPATPAEHDPTRIVVDSAPVFVLEKTVLDLNGGRVEPSDVVRYTLTLRNEGTSFGRNVLVSDPLDPNLTFVSASAGGIFDSGTRSISWSLGTLDLSTETMLSFDARIAEALDNGTPVDNQAQVISDEIAQPTLSDDPTTSAPLDPTRVLVISAADLSTSTKTFVDRNGGDARPGDLIDWTITVTNTGNAFGRSLQIQDVLDSNIEVQGAVGQGGMLSGQTLSWTLSNPLGIGESTTLTYTTRIKTPLKNETRISNQASLMVAGLVTPFLTDDPTTPEQGDPTSFEVRSAPSLSATKRVTDLNGGDVRPGDQLGYTITLKNTGDSDATDGMLVDVLDPNVDFVSATGDYTFEPTTRIVRWNVPRIGVVPAQLVLSLVTRVRRPLANGTVVANQASLTVSELGGQTLTDDPDTATLDDPTRVTVVARPDFARSQKKVFDLNGGDFSPEDEVEFVIVVKNTGDVASTNTTISDVVDPRFTDIQVLDGGVFAPSTRTITWTLPNVELSPAGDRTVRFRAKIAPLLANGIRLENQAFISDPALSQPTPTDDPSTPLAGDPTTLTIVSAPQLQTSTKAVTDVDGGLVRPGDWLRYDIVIKNIGNTYASDVTVNDALDALLETPSPAQGGIVEGSLVRWDSTTTPALSRVNPGEEVVLSFTARIREAARSGEVVSNQAVITSAEGIEAVTDDPSTVELGDPTRIELKFPDLTTSTKTVLDVNGGDPEPEDELVWTISVRNDGTLPATNVTVSDVFDTVNLVDIVPRDGGLFEDGVVQWKPSTTPALATIAPGASVELSVRSRITPLTRNATVIENQATVTAAELLAPVLTDADLATPAREKTSVTVVSTPRLQTSTLAVHDPNGDEVRPGDLLEYTLTLRNSGNTHASNVQVRLPVAAELEDVTLAGAGTIDGTTLRWTRTEVPELTSIAPNNDVVLRFSARVRSPMANNTLVSMQGEIFVVELEQPTFTDDPATPVAGDPTVVKVFSAPRFINSEKSVTDINGAPLQPGDELEYELVIINDGTETARGVRLADVVPAGTTYVPGTFTLNGTKVDDASGFPLTHGLSIRSAREGTLPGEVLVDDGVFPDDEAAVVRFRVAVSRHALAGTVIRNQGAITSATTDAQYTDDPSTPLAGDATVLVVGGGPAVDGARLNWKLVEDAGQPDISNPGDVVEITIEVPNAGDSSISCLVSDLPLDVRLSPEGDLTLNGASITGVQDGDAGEWTFDTPPKAVIRLGEIPARGVARVTLKARFNADASGVATLQAKVACQGVLERLTDSDPSLPGAQPAKIRIQRDGEPEAPDLRASVKTVEDLNGGEVMPGDVLRYRITLINDSSADAIDVAITDNLPSLLVYVEDSATGDAGLVVEGVRESNISTVSARAARVPAGSRLTATFLARLKDGIPNGRVVRNVAAVRGRNVEPFQLPPAIVTIGGIAGTSAVVGRVWEDLNGNGTWEPDVDEAYAGFQVQLMSAAADPDGDSIPVKSVFADLRGDFSLVNLPPGRYFLEVRAPDGAVWKRVELDALEPSETRLVDAQVTPTGIVYAAENGQGIAGARVFLVYDESSLGQSPPDCDDDPSAIGLETDVQMNVELPRKVGAGCLLPGQQGQLVAHNGGYRFDLPQTPEPASYRLWVVPISSAMSFPSVAIPPQSGAAPSGAVDSPRPTGGKGTWYASLSSALGTDPTTYNHVPVDALRDQIRIVKTASRGSVRLGEFVTYTVALTNNSTRDLTVDSTGGVNVVDTFPEHLRYVKGSTRALRRTPTGDACVRLNGSTPDASCDEGRVEPAGVSEGAGRLARFGAYDLKSGETLLVRYTLTVSARAKPGDYDNVAHGETSGVRITEDATATVRVLWDALFNESTVIGKVFCDDDGDRIQTPGEAGVGLARVYADNGYYVEADNHGLFHFVGLRPGLHLFKLDERSLSPGITVGDELRKTLYLTPGLDARLNFAVQCTPSEATPERVKLLQDPPPLQVRVDALSGRMSIDDAHFTLPLLTGDVTLSNDGLVELTNSGPAAPLRFDVLGLFATWELSIRAPDGTLVQKLEGTGSSLAPAIVWDGHSQTGSIISEAGTYTYQLVGTDDDGNRFESPVKSALVYRPENEIEHVFQEASLFDDTASSNFTPTGRQELEAFAKRLLEVTSPVVITGHVDVDEDAPLAAERALVVRDFLLSVGIPSERITASGRGASERISPNVTERSRMRNRRVDIRTTAELPVLTQASETLSASIWNTPLEPVDDGVFTLVVDKRPADLIDVELKGSTGRLVKYRVQKTTDDDFAMPLLLPDDFSDDVGAPGIAKASDREDGKIIVTVLADGAPPETVALKLIATLPPNGAKLRSPRLLVRGTTDTQNELTLNGQKLVVDRNSRFARVLDLQEGENTITLETTDPDGNVATLKRSYTVDSSGLFLMGIAEAETGSFGGETEGIDSLALRLGSRRNAFIGGRVAATVSGETAPPQWLGGFFKKLRLTANIDSARRNDDAGFRDLYDPTRYYPVFGDSSSLVQEAPARGPVFARIDADDSHLLFGEFRTQLGASDLLRYDRTLYGGDLLFKREWNPDITSQVQVIATPGDDRVRHGHAELRATGGSVYFLPGGNVVEGTERVRFVVRDRDTGIELSSSERARHTDYFVSYVEGRVLFKQPVSSTAEPIFLVNNNLSTAMNGHPVFVVVDYEYRDIQGNQGGVVGARTVQSFLGGLVSVGGGILQESRGSVSPYRLWGVELGTKKSDRTFAKFEFARSNGTDANSFFSPDGGLSYAPLAGRCLSQSDPACSDASGNALKFEAVGELAELLGRDGELASGRAYLQSLESGFFTNGSLLEQGTLKYGAQVKVPLTPKDALLVRHDSVESVVDRDIETAGIQPKTIIRRLTGAQYRHVEKTWGAVAEYVNAITTDTSMPEDARTIIGDTLLVGGNWKPMEDLNLTLTQEGILRGDPRLLQAWTDHLTTSVGAQYRLSEKLSINLTESVRWSGENATQIGLASQVTETSQVYVNERFTSRAGELQSTTLVGGSADLTKGLKAYGEWQLDGATSGAQNRAVIGLNNRWTLSEGLTLSAGYERTQVVGDATAALTDGGALGASPGATQGSVLGVPPFATPGLNPGVAIMPGAASRDVASVGFEWTRSNFLKAAARFEGRYDNADPEFAKTTPGVADRLQLVFLSTVDWKWTDDVAFLARVIYADAFVQDPKNPILSMRDQSSLDARYLEAIAGFAFRPKQYDWVAVLARAGRVIDRRPIDVVAQMYDEQQSDVVALAPSFETPFNVGLSFKLAYKHVRSIVTDMPEATSHVVLNVNRVDYHLLPQLDLSAEYRFLWTRVSSSGVNPDDAAFVPQGELLHGAVIEAAWRPNPFTRLGAGYSFASFSDNELARLDDFKGGFFVRATGQY